MTTKPLLRPMLLAAVATTAVLSSAAVRADDTELFVGPAVTPPVNRPNIMFILDTSGSMTSAVIGSPYDPAVTYTGTCPPNRIYWRQNTGAPPACNSDQWFDASAFRCNAAMTALNTNGLTTALTAAQWRIRAPGSPDRWENIRTSQKSAPNLVECRADRGVHGDGIDDTRLRAADNTATSGAGATRGPWNASAANEINWANNNTGYNYIFYTSNYLNWRYGPTGVSTRLAVMQNVLNQVLDGLSGVNVGLMRYSNDTGSNNDQAAEGGMVVNEIEPIETARADMKAAINSWTAAGWTPLSETYYEATQYFRGSSVRWGDTSNWVVGGPVVPSVATSRVGDTLASTTYKSPMTLDCQKNFIVYLTDGEPTQDNQSDADIVALPGFQTATGRTDCDGTGWGRCLDDLAQYLFRTDLRPTVAGTQNVTSYWIGFGGDVTGSALLERTASLGGGEFYTAADTAELVEQLTNIISRILDDSFTFTSPTVAVNAFNRTQNLNFLYMSVFKPDEQYRWLGNIKKYRIEPDGDIIDVNANPAVDPLTGFFATNARSYWSGAIDGTDAVRGGAASRLTDPATRKIYTNLSYESDADLDTDELLDLKDAGNLTLANQLLLGVASAGPVPGRPSIANLVDWAYGTDVFDVDDDGNLSEARADMGDPLHARPGAVIYDGPPDNPEIVLYATTNDGFLQAIDAATGNELWSFVPRQLLGRLELLSRDDTVAARGYGLDSGVEIVRLDRNNNGVIEESGTDIDNDGTIEENEKDKVYLFFGMRRGGSHYFALEVTDPDDPRLMWRAGEPDAWLASGSDQHLPGIGQTWSTPTAVRVNVAGHTWGDNVDKLVLVVGGGYSTTQDTVTYTADSVGNRIYMLDALTGELLWRAGPSTDTGAQLPLTKMTNAIPGEMRALDLTGDGFADRMYAADLGGRVWRFDIRNGQLPAGLVWGGVFASVGVGDLVTKPDAQNRRFFYAPDVALVTDGSRSWLNIAIGSGHREKPVTDTTVVNRFYSMRDYNIFTRISSSNYVDSCVSVTPPCHEIITDGDTRLVDITTDVNTVVPGNAAGWKLTLVQTGEKTLAESRTFQNDIYFTSFEPSEISSDPATCSSRFGINRLYVLNAATGRPVRNFDAATPENASTSDRWKELKQRGTIAPEAIFVFPTPDTGPGQPPRVDPVCLIGLESCGSGLTNPPVRTYWEQRGAN
jgi:type IV pilus assembly protein PilY1